MPGPAHSRQLESRLKGFASLGQGATFWTERLHWCWLPGYVMYRVDSRQDVLLERSCVGV